MQYGKSVACGTSVQKERGEDFYQEGGQSSAEQQKWAPKISGKEMICLRDKKKMQ